MDEITDLFPEKKLSKGAHKRDATIKPSKKYPNGRFPIGDKDHAAKALQMLPRAKGLSGDAKKKIRAKANRVLGKKK
jgi:hypothetical protein